LRQGILSSDESIATIPKAECAMKKVLSVTAATLALIVSASAQSQPIFDCHLEIHHYFLPKMIDKILSFTPFKNEDQQSAGCTIRKPVTINFVVVNDKGSHRCEVYVFSREEAADKPNTMMPILGKRYDANAFIAVTPMMGILKQKCNIGTVTFSTDLGDMEVHLENEN
jgi:hypothetical protein